MTTNLFYSSFVIQQLLTIQSEGTDNEPATTSMMVQKDPEKAEESPANKEELKVATVQDLENQPKETKSILGDKDSSLSLAEFDPLKTSSFEKNESGGLVGEGEEGPSSLLTVYKGEDSLSPVIGTVTPMLLEQFDSATDKGTKDLAPSNCTSSASLIQFDSVHDSREEKEKEAETKEAKRMTTSLYDLELMSKLMESKKVEEQIASPTGEVTKEQKGLVKATDNHLPDHEEAGSKPKVKTRCLSEDASNLAISNNEESNFIDADHGCKTKATATQSVQKEKEGRCSAVVDKEKYIPPRRQY